MINSYSVSHAIVELNRPRASSSSLESCLNPSELPLFQGWLVSALVIILALVLMTAVIGAASGATKITLNATGSAPEGSSATAIINQNANGDYIVLLQVRKVEEGQWIAWGVGTGDRISEFQCNIRGNGTDQLILVVPGGIGAKVNVKAISGPPSN